MIKRNEVFREPFTANSPAVQVRDNVIQRDAMAWARLGIKAHPLSENGIRHGDSGDHGDSRMSRHLCLNGWRANVLSAPDDDVRGAADDGKVAILVNLGQIA